MEDVISQTRRVCTREPHVRVRLTRTPASACFYEYRGKRNIITKNMAARYTRSRAVTLPRSCPGRFRLVAQRNSWRARPLVPSSLLPSNVQAFPPFSLIAHIADLHGFRDSTRIIHSRGSERSSGVVQPVTSWIYE